MNRVSVRITADRLTEINITHQPIPIVQEAEPPPQEQAPAGRLIVTSRAHGMGDLLQGAVFEVRRAIYVNTLSLAMSISQNLNF